MNINTRVFPRLFSIALTTSLGVGVSACSQADGNSPDVGTDTSSSSASTSGTSSATSTTTSNSATSSASSSTSSATSTAATSTSTATTSTAATTSQASTSSSSEATSTAAGSSSATSSSGGDSSDTVTSGDTSSNESSGDATSSDGTTSGVAEEDFVPLEEHFTCINDWENGPGFRITNVLGKTAEALAVANSEEGGGTYPVGTIVQHLPTEAMVKRHAGFSPETKDWEFYVLTPMNGVNTFVDHGPDITTMGNTCASCHLKADEPWDFICNTSKDHGGTACATFDFPQEMRDMTAANAAPCMQ